MKRCFCAADLPIAASLRVVRVSVAMLYVADGTDSSRRDRDMVLYGL